VRPFPIRNRLLNETFLGQIAFEVLVTIPVPPELAGAGLQIRKSHMCAGLNKILRDA